MKVFPEKLMLEQVCGMFYKGVPANFPKTGNTTCQNGLISIFTLSIGVVF